MRSKGVGFSQDLKKSKFERARDSRGFGIELEARESQQRARRILAILCTKNEIKTRHTRVQKRGDWIDSKSPEGTRRIGPPFPIKSNTNSHKSMDKSTLKRETGGGPAGPVRPICWTGQTGWLDRSDRCQGPVRPVGLLHPLYTISSDG